MYIFPHYLVLLQRGCKWLPDDNKKYKLNPCVEKIEKWFRFDTFTLLDCVLTDDEANPEYSANIVYYRIEEILNFQKQYGSVLYDDVRDYLLKNGYSSEDVELLNLKRSSEDQRYAMTGDDRCPDGQIES